MLVGASSPQLVWGPHPPPFPSVSRNSWAQPGLYCWEAGESTPPCGHSWTPARPLWPSHLGRDLVMRAGMGTLQFTHLEMKPLPSESDHNLRVDTMPHPQIRRDSGRFSTLQTLTVCQDSHPDPLPSRCLCMYL